ncbi:uncharacterized protein PV07_00247 [Cladophialophora immunda]|uniref:Zn(2)-C6 fungal-type domain-containing protein n=1 Tax=Cladophialophora immunda TaxID=569365 RepID=A0A0D2DCF7_9EURO|nr:uncharacterized protein PV07_00247 [Cladophialophora immunda]KIW33394.1 hypothetical protein PV07_00247 [Cladophialophora immunda]OQU97540.1 Fungal specific transcription factor domain-containing protein [Cladophialophora immunda]
MVNLPVNVPNNRRSSAKTCVQCRARKVRCDGRPGFCRNCERLRFDCSFQRPVGSPASNRGYKDEAQLEKRRVPTACTVCRSLKVRCPGEFPACENCVRKNRQCIYLALKQPSHPSQPCAVPSDETQQNDTLPIPTDLEPKTPSIRSEGGVSPPERFSPDSGTVIPLIEAYFEHLYPLPAYAFLHRKSLTQRYREGSLESCLILALCAVTAQRLRFQPCYPESVSDWAEKAEQDLMHNIKSPSIPRLQALVLVIRYMIDVGQFPKAFMLAALVGRAAAALRLYSERPDLPFLTQETRRRLMWSCVLLDGSFSVALREYEICPPEAIEIQLPCPDRAFEEGTPMVTAPVRAVSKNSVELLGLVAAAVRLTAIRRDIMRLTRRLKSPGVSFVELMHSVQCFEGEMQRLYQNLSEPNRYSSLMFTQSEEPVRLLLVHLSWHQAHCDLYRIFLTGYREAAPVSTLQKMNEQKILGRQSLCLQHAVAIVHLLAQFSEQCTVQIIDFDTAICAYHSSRLVLHIAGTNVLAQGPSQADALQMARSCASTLKKYFGTTAMADPIIKDLDTIITRYSCEWGTEPGPPPQRAEATGEDDEATQTRTRQQFAIHSLFRQANFDGDSNHDTIISETTPSMVEFQLATMPQIRSRLLVPAGSGAATPPGGLPHGDLQNSGSEMTPEQQQAGHLQADPAPTRPNTLADPMLDYDRSCEELENDMQLVFNPWMGFSESLESYGLTLTLDEDYF